MRPSAPAPSPRSTDWAALIPQILVGALTALIVARPLVAGDDPGRLRLTSGGGTLTLNLLALLLLLAWAVWNGISRRRAGVGGFVTLCLLGVAAWHFIATSVAATYQRPGWFAAWEWIAVAAIFCMTRWLSHIPGASTGLLSAVLASVVSLSAVAVYDVVAKPLGLPSAETPKPGVMPALVGDEEFPMPWTKNLASQAERLTRATFDSPESFAGYLLLFVPLLLWAGWHGLRDGSKRGWLVFACAVATMLALTLTIPAFLQRWELNRGTWNLAEEQWAHWRGSYHEQQLFPWFGVGSNVLHINWPSRYGWLMVSMFVGIPALIMLFAAMGFAGWRAHRATVKHLIAGVAEPAPISGPRWQFYFGGVAGLLIGFILSTGDIPAESKPSAMLHAGAVAAIRALIWFAAFSLFENIVWRPGRLIHLLLLGLGMIGAFGCFSSSVLLPPLLWAFWVVAALALNLSSPLHPLLRTPHFGSWTVVPFALTLLVANLIHVTYPGLVTANAVRAARAASQHLPDQARAIEIATGTGRIEAIQRYDRYIVNNVLAHMRRAARSDPDNAALLLELARWSRPHWQNQMALREVKAAADLSRQILFWTDRATKLNPDHRAGPAGTAEALLLLLDESKTLRKERLDALEKALDAQGHSDDLRFQQQQRVVRVLLDLAEMPAVDRKDEDSQAIRAALQRRAKAMFQTDNDNQRANHPSRRTMSAAERKRLIERLQKALLLPPETWDQ